MGKNEQNKRIAEVLAEFVSVVKYNDLPAETIELAKQFVLDVIGCIAGASREPQSQALLEVIKVQGGNPTSSVFAHGLMTSEMNAALVNGTMGHILDFDDDHREGTLHPSAAVFPAVFAVGERLHASGKDFLRALILGLEVMIRVGESFVGKTYYQGFHPTGTCGVFGSAAGCALLLNLNVEQVIYALGLAGSFSAGTTEYKTEGSWQKPLQAGHPAMAGILAASLAQRDFVGAGTIFEGPNGIVRAFSFKDEYDCSRITKDLGKKWEMVDTSIKVHACCRFSAPIVDCGLDLFRQGVRAKDVKEIHAKVCDHSIRALCNPIERKVRPLTHVDAQFSLPYAAAVAVCRNRAGAEEFKSETRTDPEILELAKKVTWELDPEAEALYPRAYPATLIATLNDGRKFQAHVDYPKGDPENPATTEEVLKKFHSLTENIYDQDRRAGIVREVNRLEKVEDMAAIGDLLR